jgi:hypothetical protein
MLLLLLLLLLHSSRGFDFIRSGDGESEWHEDRRIAYGLISKN